MAGFEVSTYGRIWVSTEGNPTANGCDRTRDSGNLIEGPLCGRSERQHGREHGGESALEAARRADPKD